MSIRARPPFPVPVLLSAAACWLGGCAVVPVSQHDKVSRSGMLFSDSAVHAPRSNLLGQIEPGTAVSGGAQAAGCTSCR